MAKAEVTVKLLDLPEVRDMLAEAGAELDRLREQNDGLALAVRMGGEQQRRLLEALDAAVYHADNLARVNAQRIVRDLAESRAAFENARALLVDTDDPVSSSEASS